VTVIVLVGVFIALLDLSSVNIAFPRFISTFTARGALRRPALTDHARVIRVDQGRLGLAFV
jgi:hypothetical protein